MSKGLKTKKIKKTLPVPKRIREYKTIAAKNNRTVFVDNYDLPSSYNTTSLTLVARDPYWIYAYWEISASSLEALKKKTGITPDNCSYVLRMYDVTFKDFNGSNANHWFDIDFSPRTNNWYINLYHDNVTYCGEIGLKTAEGKFFPLARSNFVTTPRTGVSGRSDEIWMEVKDYAPQKPFILAPERRKKQRSTASAPVKPRRRIFLTEDDIRAYYSRLFPLLRAVSSRQKKGKGPGGIQKVFLKDGYGLSDIKGGSIDKLKKIVLPGASEELLLGASERQQEKKRDFYFEVGTELIVYGRTEPDAEVFLGDKKIPLRKDGTFSLRFALPDGKIPLDFTAVSEDKAEKRKINLLVERKAVE